MKKKHRRARKVVVGFLGGENLVVDRGATLTYEQLQHSIAVMSSAVERYLEASDCDPEKCKELYGFDPRDCSPEILGEIRDRYLRIADGDGIKGTAM